MVRWGVYHFASEGGHCGGAEKRLCVAGHEKQSRRHVSDFLLTTRASTVKSFSLPACPAGLTSPQNETSEVGPGRSRSGSGNRHLGKHLHDREERAGSSFPNALYRTSLLDRESGLYSVNGRRRA